MIETVFFGPEGRTSSSAGHLRNLAKEYYKRLEEKLQNLRFVNTDIEIIGSGVRNQALIGVTEIDNIPNIIQEIGECKALCAYLNEAIKAKDTIKRRLAYYEMPEYTEHKKKSPKCEDELTPEEVKASWDIKKRQRYFYLEAMCASYGKAIHKDGTVSNAREDLIKKMAKPIDVITAGRDSLFNYHSASIDPQSVENLYFQLQKEHRKLEAELNGLLNEIDLTIEEDRRKKLDAYKAAYEKWSEENTKLSTASTQERNRFLEENKKLKIVIPNSLKPIIEKIEKL